MMHPKDFLLRFMLFLAYLMPTNMVLATEAPSAAKEPIYLLVESPYDYAQTKKNIFAAIKAMNFRAYKPRLLEQDLGLDNGQVDPNKQVFRFCNFQMLDNFVKLEPRLGVFLPCNIAVLRMPDNKVYISVMNVRRIAQMFNNPKLAEGAAMVEDIINELIEEATL